MRVSAYIPCYNNRRTIAACVRSVQSQDTPVDELFVVDDGSTDASAEVVEAMGVRVLRQPANLGRGAARARAMQEARSDLVLCCDATKALAPDFLTRALPWFVDSCVAAVFGRLTQSAAPNVVHRWRGRHLLRLREPTRVTRRALLATGGVVARKAAVMGVGSFDPTARHSEDADLGRRLLAAGHDVVFDPSLLVLSYVEDTVASVLERYWRWYAGREEHLDWRGYPRLVWYSVKVLAAQDLRERDPASVPLSLVAPHYQFWKTVVRKLRRRSGSAPAGHVSV